MKSFYVNQETGSLLRKEKRSKTVLDTFKFIVQETKGLL